MDPLAINWIDLVERLGVPVAMCVFICVLYVRQVRLSRIDRLACAKEYRTLRNYTDRAIENIREAHNRERNEWLSSVGDLTAVLSDLLVEIKERRAEEKKSAAEIIAHIDRAVKARIRV